MYSNRLLRAKYIYSVRKDNENIVRSRMKFAYCMKLFNFHSASWIYPYRIIYDQWQIHRKMHHLPWQQTELCCATNNEESL